MSSTWSAYARPHTPAAKCLHLVRLNSVTSRSELVSATGLSQPTVTRAVSSLVESGFVVERADLAQSQGRGRPIIPIELADTGAIYAGIAVATASTYIALFDIKGRTIRETDVPTDVANLAQGDFIQHIMAALNRMLSDLKQPLATVGVTTSGSVTPDGVVTAPNLGWFGEDIGAQLQEQFSVPVTVTAAVAGIVGSEIQSTGSISTPPTMALYVDDSIGAAVSHETGVLPIAIDREDLTTQGMATKTGIAKLSDAVVAAHTNTSLRAALDQRIVQLGELAADLVNAHSPATLVVAGSAFTDDPKAPAIFARVARSNLPDPAERRAVNLRMIPTHREVVRDIARAVALDLVLREPLRVSRENV
ncbi:ROK family transcriptional regulator [Corynebacterium aquatimens]|uniref:NBD/HSP70 family sugar kinase n=1 Tax=Corynebacterium aquatimens TaxID=1190508 RepID=A0A931E3S9_9CORY|nr:ROK family transcriptional regulator [Corynebacterium aquatimens]MBG6122621.1 putative NBD/HSP70 family sugar kinase [Corynebacterium aquatimens]